MAVIWVDDDNKKTTKRPSTAMLVYFVLGVVIGLFISISLIF